MTMTQAQAEGGHCTRGGTIRSGKAVCQCGYWKASDPVSRSSHLESVRMARQRYARINAAKRERAAEQ
jgi:hypothetical protein